MQRNQSFFASASHLYNIYDYFLSSRAKVNKMPETEKKKGDNLSQTAKKS